MNNLHEKAIAASERFLERRGYEVLSTSWGGTRRLRHHRRRCDGRGHHRLRHRRGQNATDGFPEEDNNRVKRETLAAKWLEENAERGDVSVRFDAISMMVVNEDRALLRHHINQLSTMESDEE